MKKAVSLSTWEKKRAYVLDQVEAIREIDSSKFDYHQKQTLAELKAKYDIKAKEYNSLMEFLYRMEKRGLLNVNEWEVDTVLNMGDRITYNGADYELLIPFLITTEDYPPDKTPECYQKIEEE